MTAAASAAKPALARQEQSASVPDLDVRIDNAIHEALSAGACAGAQVAVARDGVVLFSRGYGRANLETGTPATPDSVFRIGSLTKQFTAAAVIRLAADGRLSALDPVSRHLPFMADLPSATLLELMNHTAGFHSDDGATDRVSPGTGAKSQIDIAREITTQSGPFDFPPGTAWLYSNANYHLLGAVIEAVTGMTLSEAIQALLTAPLGLANTAVDRSAAVVANRASGYVPLESEQPRFENAMLVEVSDAGGAGAMRSTALDLCHWHHSLLSGRLLDAEHLGVMTRPGTLRDGRVSGANRFSADDANYGEVQYGAGLLISPPDAAHPSLMHYGGIGGFSSVLETYTAQKVTLAVLCNGEFGPAVPFRAVRRAVSGLVLRAA